MLIEWAMVFKSKFYTRVCITSSSNWIGSIEDLIWLVISNLTNIIGVLVFVDRFYSGWFQDQDFESKSWVFIFVFWSIVVRVLEHLWCYYYHIENFHEKDKRPGYLELAIIFFFSFSPFVSFNILSWVVLSFSSLSQNLSNSLLKGVLITYLWERERFVTIRVHGQRECKAIIIYGGGLYIQQVS